MIWLWCCKHMTLRKRNAIFEKPYITFKLSLNFSLFAGSAQTDRVNIFSSPPSKYWNTRKITKCWNTGEKRIKTCCKLVFFFNKFGKIKEQLAAKWSWCCIHVKLRLLKKIFEKPYDFQTKFKLFFKILPLIKILGFWLRANFTCGGRPHLQERIESISWWRTLAKFSSHF